jgi:arsenate reductase (glutaredoxin)
VTILYGIKNCDTMKKARSWLDSHSVAYEFHDYKAAGIDRALLERWCARVGWETLLNRAGTTFRKLPEEQKSPLDERRAVALMVQQPSMIKRPVLEWGGQLLVGFRVDTWSENLLSTPSRPGRSARRAPSEYATARNDRQK